MLNNHRISFKPLGMTALNSYQRESWDISLRIIYLFLQLVDLALTFMAAQLGYAEINPFMRATLSSPLSLMVIKAFIPLLICWVVPGKYLIPAIAFLCGILAWNVQQLLQLAF